jgi:KaiC/GvpD/RAD55 family RecA-like ATPase
MENSKMERISTGIGGFDEICGGGLIKRRSYLLLGTAGAGKTIFCLQFLHSGATKHGENGIFVTTDQHPSIIKEDAAAFGWDFEALEKEGKIAFVDASLSKLGVEGKFDMDSVVDRLIDVQKEISASRAVVDSSTSIAQLFPSSATFRSEMLKLSTTLRALGLTSLIVSEAMEDKKFGVETFVTDGVIVLYFRRILDTRIHSIEVYKMRGSSHSRKVHPFDITSTGIIVNPGEGVFGEF